MARLIAVVTGANGGLGYGICLRLLLQLSQQVPPDCRPQEKVDPNHLSSSGLVRSPYDSVTLILACRNKGRALDARERLLIAFDTELLRRKRDNRGEDDAYARNFRDTLQIDFVRCDLGSISSVFEFCDAVKSKYPYVSRIICNAAIGSFSGIDIYAASWQCIFDPIGATSHPIYLLQSSGSLSDDGIGKVWQSNIFSHYLIQRELESSLSAAPSQARVIWVSSLDGLGEKYDPEDWQLVQSTSSYQVSKYQIELIAHQLNETHNPQIRHLVVGPGVVTSNMLSQFVSPLFLRLGSVLFRMVQWLGSPNHLIDPWKGAISAIHASLVPIDNLPPSNSGLRLDAQVDQSGNEIVNVTRTEGHPEMAEVAARLLEKMDALCETFQARDGRKKSVAMQEVDGDKLDGSIVIV